MSGEKYQMSEETKKSESVGMGKETKFMLLAVIIQ